MTINDELRAMRERVEAMECGDAEWSDAADCLTTHDLPRLLDAVERVMAIKSPPKPPEWDFEGLQEWAGHVDALALVRAAITEALDS